MPVCSSVQPALARAAGLDAVSREEASVTITLNGEARSLTDGTTLGELIATLGVRRDGIAVARNDDVVPRAVLDATPLADGDAVEIIVAVAGG